MITTFPTKLVNTAVTPALLSGGQYAREIINMIPNSQKAGSGAKRFGVDDKGSAISGVVAQEMMEYRDSSGQLQVLLYCDDGTIRTYNDTLDTYATVKSGLSSDGLCRYAAFNEKLIIVDGINTPMSWNGSSIVELSEWVEDVLATSHTQTDTNTIVVAVASGRTDYEVGQQIRVEFASTGEVTATISAVSYSGSVTIDVTGTPFPSSTETIVKVEYEKSPPAFSDIYVEHNMLWALSAGETRAQVYRGSDSMKVFFTSATNNENAWFNTTTQEVGFVDLTNKSRTFDELLRISSIDGNMVFFGRQKVFVYAGDDPLVVGGFQWVKTLPIGCANGNLVKQYPNDILFFTPYGARSLTNVVQNGEMEISEDLGTSIDPTVTEMITRMSTSDEVYRAARSFFYERDGFYGFKLDNTYTVINLLSEESRGWVFFSGAFTSADSFLATSDGRLLINTAGQLQAYGNGTDTDVGTVYADSGAAILCKWWTPWLTSKGKRWGNKGLEVYMDETTDTTITLRRATDYRDDSIVERSGIELRDASSYWDVSYWDTAYWDAAQKRIIIREKFLCDAFWLQFENESTVGPLSVLGIKPIGN